MKFKHRFVGIGTLIVLLFVFGFSQLQAQSSPITLESLSGRITTLTRRITALSSVKANRAEVRLLEKRVASLEAMLEETRPAPTSTPRRPTSTATRRQPTPTRTNLRPNATSTPTTPFVTSTRRTNVRQGPGTSYDIVGVTEGGETFDITGKSIAGDWWRIEYEGQNAWIYAAIVIATNADGIRVVPTPAPPSTATPVPSAVSQQSSGKETAFTIQVLALFLAKKDFLGAGSDFKALSQAGQNGALSQYLDLLNKATVKCGLSFTDMSTVVDKYGDILDSEGYSLKHDTLARFGLLRGLIDTPRPANVSCEMQVASVIPNLLNE